MKVPARSVQQILSTSGLPGLCRTVARRALLRVRDAAEVAQTSLLHVEARARVPKAERDLVRQNVGLRGVHAGQRCFIIGTGPSLRNYDVTLLKDEIVIGVNGLIQHPQFDLFPPRYYALMDWGFFDDAEASEDFFTRLRAQTPNCDYFVPSRFHEAVTRHGWLPAARTHYIAMDGYFADAPTSVVDIADFLPGTPNAVQFALAIALYMGFDNIYLLGADHDWLTRRYEGLAQWDKHFYEGTFIDRRPRSGDQLATFETYTGTMWYCTTLWRGYRNLAAVAARSGQAVHVHAESYIDVLPRFDFAKVLAPRDE